MILELHDAEEGNTLVARVNDIDHEYQAEEWVNQTYQDHPSVISWQLKSGEGQPVLREWKRPEGSLDFPEST